MKASSVPRQGGSRRLQGLPHAGRRVRWNPILHLALLLLSAGGGVAGPQEAAPADASATLRVRNGWLVQGDRGLWGNAQHNGWWRPGQRPNLTRRAPGEVRPNRTEDLGKLTDNMLRFGYPGFEHNFGLWYDRRRDKHDTTRQQDDRVQPPFLEQPWARGDSGRAWDGLPRYDLTRFNPWYFERLKAFAGLCDRKGTVLLFNFYMQHALLEIDAHYVDFPWRPPNCLQATGMPDRVPAANVFYDVSHPVRRRLHRMYIRKCLAELGAHSQVLFRLSEEYTGPASFVEFWLDTVTQWEQETGRDVPIVLAAGKDVMEEVLAQPRWRQGVSVLDLRYWWYRADGSLFAPPGGREVAGRYASGAETAKTTPEQIYRQVKEWRRRYPAKAILHCLEASREQTWAFLMGGGSLLVRRLEYPGGQDPADYIAPEHAPIIQPTYDFLRRHLATALPRTKPLDRGVDPPGTTWGLADPGRTYLIYALRGGAFRVDLSAVHERLRARWFNPRTGALTDVDGGWIDGGRPVAFAAPDTSDWALWLQN